MCSTVLLEHICKLKGVQGNGLHVKLLLFAVLIPFVRRGEEKSKRGEEDGWESPMRSGFVKLPTIYGNLTVLGSRTLVRSIGGRLST